MTETIKGEIVFAQVGKIPQTGENFGFVTVKNEDDESVELKIDNSTEHGLLLNGEKVTVEFKEIEDSDRPLALKIIADSEPTPLFETNQEA